MRHRPHVPLAVALLLTAVHAAEPLPVEPQALAERASGILPTGAPGWLRAQDIVSETERRLEKQ